MVPALAFNGGKPRQLFVPFGRRFDHHDVAVISRDRDSAGDIVNVSAGSIGTVVMVYDKSVGSSGALAYEIDFCDSTGDTVALLTLAPDDIKLDRSFKTMKKAG